MSSMFKTLLNLLFPPHCTFCKREGDFLCTQCIANFKKKSLRKLEQKNCSKKEFKYLDGVIYGLDYAQNPAIQAAISQFKYKFTRELSEHFGNLMAEKLNQLQMVGGKEILLIPVPLHQKRLSERGFNQAELLSKAVQLKYKTPLRIEPVLIRTKNTRQQARLNKSERHKNLEAAFKLNKKFVHKNRVIFLVDDVCTTGATLENCAKTLKEAGVAKVYGLTIARAMK